LHKLTGGTLFSGIGAPEAAAPKIDWRWCAEIDPFASAVLAERFPHLLNLGDVRKIKPAAIEPVDLVVFGSPCQSFSVAGKRQGLDDPRGNLAFVALGLIGRIRPRWVVFENVPGLLSSGAGRDFGAILGALAKCGYGFAYRILDAQFFGVPQRRRRLFIVGCLGDWRAAAAVLFERQSLRRDPAPRRDARQDIAGNLAAVPLRASGSSTTHGGGIGRAGDPAMSLDQDGSPAIAYALRTANTGANGQAIAFDTTQITHPENRSQPKPGGPCHPLAAAGHAPAIAFESRFVRNGCGAPLKAQSGLSGKGDAAPLVFKASHFTRGKDGAPAVVTPLSADADKGDQDLLLAFGGNRQSRPLNVAPPLSGGHGGGCVHQYRQKGNEDAVVADPLSVAPPRRLTPRECERLQGLPADWTAIEFRGKPAADGPRYRAIGKSMAAPVMRWILDRIRGCAR